MHPKNLHTSVFSFFFLFSLFSIQLSVWTYSFTGIHLDLQHVIGVLVFYALVIIFIKMFFVFRNDFLLLYLYIFILLVTFPFTILISMQHPAILVIGLKNIFYPFIFFLFLKATHRIHHFPARFYLRLIVFAGIIASLYSILEMSLHVFGFFPFITSALTSFEKASNLTRTIGSVVDVQNYDIIFYRPTGIFLTMQSHGFTILVALFLVLILNKYLFHSFFTYLLVLFILFSGLLVSLVRIYIAIFVIIGFGFLTLYLLILRPKGPYIPRLQKSLLFLILLGFLSIILFYPIFEFNFGNMLSLTEGVSQSQSFDILREELGFVCNLIGVRLFSHKALHTLFGFGFHRYSFYNNLFPFNELHFMGSQIAAIGLIGFSIYWLIIMRSMFSSFKHLIISSLPKDLAAINLSCSVILMVFLLLFSTIIHSIHTRMALLSHLLSI